MTFTYPPSLILVFVLGLLYGALAGTWLAQHGRPIANTRTFRLTARPPSSRRRRRPRRRR